MSASSAQGHDAILLFSFGGPEGPDDVVPFLENVTRGRGIPRERLVEVGAHYSLFDGVSPINQQNRDLLAALEPELRQAGIDLPVYFGNRNWHPFLADTLDQVASDGHERVLVLVTSAFGSPSGCRQYRDDLERVAAERAEAGAATLTLDKVRLYWNHPGFLEASQARLTDALEDLDPSRRERSRLVFTAHSVPSSWTAASPYVDQLHAAARHLATTVAPDLEWDLVYQSRSGPPQVPWLEPDIVDHLDALHADGTDTVVIMPIGFVSDHMEVVYDLDTEAADRAQELGMTMVRAGTVGTHPAFVAALRQLLEERLHGTEPLATIGEPWACPAGCCEVPQRPKRP